MASTLIGGARVNLSAKDAEFQRAMKRAGAAFDKQERELKRLRKQTARTNKAYAAMGKSLKTIVGIGVGAALAGLAKANLDSAKATAEWGSNLVKVSDRLAVMPSQLFALQSAFEDDNIAIQTTNQNLTALSRRFASDAPAMRRAADKVGISLKEWDKTGGDLAKLLPIISEAMRGTATQAEKLNFLQEAGSTSARKFLTTLQRSNFDEIVKGYQSANSELDKTAKKLEALDQLFTDIERREKLAIADTITANLQGYERFAKLLSDIKVYFVNIAANIGKALDRLDKAAERGRQLEEARSEGGARDTRNRQRAYAQGASLADRTNLSDYETIPALNYPAIPEHVYTEIERFKEISESTVKQGALKTGEYWKRIAEQSAKDSKEAAEKAAKAWNETIDRVFGNTDKRMMDDNLFVGVDRIIKAQIDKQREAREEAKRYEEQYAQWYENTQMRIAEASISQIERQKQAMDDFINGVQIDLFDMEATFKSVLNRMANELTKFATTGESDFFSAIGKFLGGLTGGGGLFGRNSTSPGIPHRQSGGGVRAGQPTWVGEAGKELIVPARDGYVIPNHRLNDGGSGNSFVMNFNINGGDERGVESALYRSAPIIQDMVMKAINRKMTNNTEFRANVRRGAQRG